MIFRESHLRNVVVAQKLNISCQGASVGTSAVSRKNYFGCQFFNWSFDHEREIRTHTLKRLVQTSNIMDIIEDQGKSCNDGLSRFCTGCSSFWQFFDDISRISWKKLCGGSKIKYFRSRRIRWHQRGVQENLFWASKFAFEIGPWLVNCDGGLHGLFRQAILSRI